MSLPTDFSTPHDYFKEAIHFLRQHAWIYQEANTCFLKSNVLANMPKEFCDYFQQIETDELNIFPNLHQALAVADSYNQPPIAVKNFRHHLASLIPKEAYEEPPTPREIPLKMENFKKMNVKKRHEIQRLANIVYQRVHDAEHQQCVLIDFGCGLGYLSEILCKLNENFLILGLESDEYRVAAAAKRLQEYMPQAKHRIHYCQQYITENSSQAFIEESTKELLQSNYNETASDRPDLLEPLLCPQMAIIGLHACADLTITSMKLFLRMPQVRHLLIMPCCYHKMQMCDDNTLTFRNFPLSGSLRQVLAEESANTTYNYVKYLNRPFLRLACQQTLKRWQKCSTEQHRQHGREMFLRAVAEALTRKETEMVVKCKEKFDLSSQYELADFERFQHLYRLQSKSDGVFVEWSEDQRQEFLVLMEQYPNGDKLAEGLTCLQTAMQKLCENFVLYDRLCYMQEAAVELKLKLSVRYEKLMDEELSPRCYVLIAEKL